MSMNGPLARAARALIQWPRSHVAKIAELDEETLARFEAGGSMLAASELTRLRDALERGGAVFIDEDHRAGSGVRLKFNANDVPLSFHPAATRVLGLVTPRSVG